MKKYAITVREVLEKTVCVEAKDLDEAIDKVASAYRRVEIILEPEDLSDRDFIPSPYASENGIITEDMIEDYKDYQWIKGE